MRVIEHGGVSLADDSLHVWMGEDPPAFDITIPLPSIASIERLPDATSGNSIGVHGMFGRWLINASHANLVRLKLRPRVPARVDAESSLADIGVGVPRLLKPLVRARTTNVRELTISVDDPDELIAAIRSARPASSPRPAARGTR